MRVWLWYTWICATTNRRALECPCLRDFERHCRGNEFGPTRTRATTNRRALECPCLPWFWKTPSRWSLVPQEHGQRKTDEFLVFFCEDFYFLKFGKTLMRWWFWLYTPHRSQDVDRVLKSKNNLPRSLCLHWRTSFCLASGRQLHRLIMISSAMLTCVIRFGSSVFLSTFFCLLLPPPELNHMCRKTSPSHCVPCTFRTAVYRRWLRARWCQCFLARCTTPLCVRPPLYLCLNTEVVRLLAHLRLETAKWNEHSSWWAPGEATGQPMHGNLLGLLVNAVRLHMIFNKWSFDRVRRLLQYILLEILRISDPSLVLWPDQLTLRVGMPLVMNVVCGIQRLCSGTALLCGAAEK